MSNLFSFIERERPEMLRELKRVVKNCQGEIKADRSLYIDGEHDEPSIDVRLCIDHEPPTRPNQNESQWCFRTGSADYDQRHSTYCGASCITLDTVTTELLDALISDATDYVYKQSSFPPIPLMLVKS